MTTPSIVATLYTKPGCHLCEDAIADLARLNRRYPHTLRQLDITADAQLQRRYGDQIPVLELGGRAYAAPLPYAVLERALRDATPPPSAPAHPPPGSAAHP